MNYKKNVKSYDLYERIHCTEMTAVIVRCLWFTYLVFGKHIMFVTSIFAKNFRLVEILLLLKIIVEWKLKERPNFSCDFILITFDSYSIIVMCNIMTAVNLNEKLIARISITNYENNRNWLTTYSITHLIMNLRVSTSVMQLSCNIWRTFVNIKLVYTKSDTLGFPNWNNQKYCCFNAKRIWSAVYKRM